MIETPLLRQGGDFVVGAPEIADQNSPEYGAQDLSYDRRAPAFGDQVIAERFVGETPKPMGYAVESPSGLIGVQYPTLGDFLSNMIVSRLQ